ncbi:MAG TPA: universal stress protein [Acidimicrobiales bacterium]|jgi:nucleotide-binding universal stress UspA family protein|nr:universal stress protein [Acidimicrobiales bacterium]
MFERFLLAIDDTSAGDVGISFATALARKHGASVHVFHANEFILGGRGVTAETNAEATRLVENAVDQLRAAGVEATGECVLANVFTLAPRITEAASRSGANAILFGSHRHRWLTRFLGKGVRERVTRMTPLPVLTAPSPLKISGRRHGPDVEVRRLALAGGQTSIA